MPDRLTTQGETLGGYRRRGISLGEMLMAAAIVGVVALVVVPRLAGNSKASRIRACHTLCGNIELEAQLWYRNYGSWPLSSLSDIGDDADYFPQGISTCPVDGTAYELDTSTGEVIGHEHGLVRRDRIDSVDVEISRSVDSL